MGRGMVLNLAKAGREVRMFDIHEAALASAASQHGNITAAKSLAEAAKGSIVVVSVAGEAAERAVLLGEGGIMESAAPGTLIVNCGTNTVDFSRSLHEAATKRGLRFVDAPVSGGPEGAANGTLAIMCGGREEDVEAARDVLEAMGQYIVRMGGAGTGSAAKLVNQLLTAANANSAAEGLALAQALGMEPPDIQTLLDLLGRAWGNSTMLQRSGGILNDANATDDPIAALQQDAAAPLRNFRKDLDFVLAAAASSGLSLRSTQAARDMIALADSKGLDAADWAVAVDLLRPVAAPPAATSAPNTGTARVFGTLEELAASLPAPWPEPEEALLLRASVLNARRGLPLAVVDDDPTGTQTVHSVPALASWTPEALGDALAEPHPCFYVLSNTRALTEVDAVARAEEIGRNLRSAAVAQGKEGRLAVVSRGDSTLRGHYPTETDALARGLGWGSHTVVLAPFFQEGGRLTAHDVHYVLGADGSTLSPVGDTEFAKDRAFGFKASYLPEWVEEKTGGAVPKEQVHSLSIDLIRTGGPDAVAEKMASLPASGAVVLVNALTKQDMAVVGLGCLQAELQGGLSRVIYRTAGSFVAANSGMPPRGLLTPQELAKGYKAASSTEVSRGGLMVVGSYVGKSSQQLEVLQQACPWMRPVELDVARLAGGEGSWRQEESRARQEVEAHLQAGLSVVLYTSRELVQNDGQGGLKVGQLVTDALCSVVQRLQCNPHFIIAKGGITSNDVAVEALGVKRAMVLGQVVPGVPVWKCGPESKMPGLNYVVFPGNVGAPDDLARVALKMSGRGEGGGNGVSIPAMLCEAREHGRAVGAFNVYNLEGALAVKAAAERVQAPAILQLHPASVDFGGTPLLALCQAIARDSAVPMAVQLDHAQSEQAIAAALHAGVNGIMADGSHLPFEENSAWTARMAALARVHGASVEAELGKLAGEEDGLSVPEVEARMTDPAVVADFLFQTGVDSLAVTIGNVHGKYARPPSLDFKRLNEIRNVVGNRVPLVLHGASGLPPPLIAQSIKAGICKFNVNTEVRAAARKANVESAAAGADVLDCMKASTEAMVPVIEEKMKLFGW